MLTWEELLERALSYLEEKYPNRHSNYNASDFLFDLMQNGEDGETVSGVHETIFRVPSDDNEFAFVIRAYWVPAQDEYDEDRKIGYLIDCGDQNTDAHGEIKETVIPHNNDKAEKMFQKYCKGLLSGRDL